MGDAEIQSFIDQYAPETAAEAMECRSKMRSIIKNGFELVYDNYNALVFAYGPTEKSRTASISIAVYPHWIRLFFLEGKDLDDPDSLLEGSGKQVRSVKLHSAEDLEMTNVRALIHKAMGDSFESAPPLKTVVKSVSAKRRPRR